jgi:hypothetical protein
MNRSKKVREVYIELRSALGDHATSTEALEYAGSLVDLFSCPAYETKFDLRTGGLPFSQWALDAAMADGGWRILSLETQCEEDLMTAQDREVRLHNRLIHMAEEVMA